MIKQCSHCGKEFDARGASKYCSADCRTIVIRERNRLWKQNNPDKVREEKHQWSIANRQNNYERHKRWRKNHREQYNASQRRRRAERKHKNWVAERSARLRKILAEKAAARQAQQPKCERHWAEDVSFPLVSSCQATLIY